MIRADTKYLPKEECEHLTTYQSLVNYVVAHPIVKTIFLFSQTFIDLEMKMDEELFRKFSKEDELGHYIRVGGAKVRPRKN